MSHGLHSYLAVIAYGVQMATNVSDRHYDIGVKGQGQIYLKSVLWLLTNLSYIYRWSMIFGTL